MIHIRVALTFGLLKSSASWGGAIGFKETHKMLDLNYYHLLYSVVVSYLCVVRGCLSSIKNKFYLNSEYIILYSMQRVHPLNCLSFIRILQSSV